MLLALALECGESEHLARRHGQADLVELAPGADATGLEDRAPVDAGRTHADARLLAYHRGGVAEHRRDDLRLAALARHERCDAAAVAEHGAHVAVLANLGEAVRDEQH